LKTNLQVWLVAWVDLAVALVVLLTAARIRPHWDSHVRWGFLYKELKKTSEDGHLGI
jgi:hypothetical protein